MQRRMSIEMMAVAVGLVALAAGVFAQAPAQAPAGRGAAAPAGRGAAPAEAATRPALLFKEEWKQPPYTGTLNDENRRVTQAAVTNPKLELKLYGADAQNIGVYVHEGRLDLWSGITTSPTAVTLRDKTSYFDLTGLARLRWIVRTNALHTVYPIVKLADGTMAAGSRGVSTDGEYIESEVSFGGTMRWFKLDPAKVVTTVAVPTPDLSKVDELGWVDLAPGGGHGNAGWNNVSTIELYAKAVPR
jgi:hypothetical protein